ncbi:MAG: TIR domain-containing protein [Gammaproteobacteria bacterium]|nr:TIR domain-containing protein [Gammaproteobacteria bacterium]
MEIFVSWAGRESHSFALILRRWLPQVLPFARPWVSSEDIRKGTRWDEELWSRLQQTSYALICATPVAVRSPWVNFEAGVVARAVGVESHVSPLLIGISPGDLGDLPLGKFQCTEFTESDMARLVNAINISAAAPLPTPQVTESFRRLWGGLRQEIERIDLPNFADYGEQDDFEEETVSEWLEEIEDKILATVAWSGDHHPLELQAIVRDVDENHVRAQHHVDRLVGRGFLHERLSTGRPPTYFVTKEGRAYAVENDLV